MANKLLEIGKCYKAKRGLGVNMFKVMGNYGTTLVRVSGINSDGLYTRAHFVDSGGQYTEVPVAEFEKAVDKFLSEFRN